MPRGRKTLILALFILLTATVSASLSVKPSVVNYEDNQDTFSVTITNPGPEPSGAIWFMLEQADGTDPLTIQGTPQNVTPDTFTATVMPSTSLTTRSGTESH
ncbi:MAG: hypothetical protein SVU32_05005 [Candidatus Nanohaloarchaea archaeon]|nr:hypothetical protein [Candidatus Nanohaloarchaea archaeon]